MNLLLAIKGHIYEVSHFVDHHPGEGIANVYLTEHNRSECSEYFEKYRQTNDSEQMLIDSRNNENDKIKYVGPNYFKQRIPKYYYYIPDITKVDLTQYPSKSYFMFQSDENNNDTINVMVKDGMGLTTIHHLKLIINKDDNTLIECQIELCSYLDNLGNSNKSLDDAKIVTNILKETTIEQFMDIYFTKQGYKPILKINFELMEN